jgi:hypothetical protein
MNCLASRWAPMTSYAAILTSAAGRADGPGTPCLHLENEPVPLTVTTPGDGPSSMGRQRLCHSRIMFVRSIRARRRRWCSMATTRPSSIRDLGKGRTRSLAPRRANNLNRLTVIGSKAVPRPNDRAPARKKELLDGTIIDINLIIVSGVHQGVSAFDHTGTHGKCLEK